jgi:hypothetical protein
MKYRAMLVLLTMALIFAASDNDATIVYGSDLVQYMQAYDKQADGTPLEGKDLRNASLFVQYIEGVLTTAPGGTFWGYQLPDGETIGQVNAAVSKYIKAHPEKWNATGTQLILEALREAFPAKLTPADGSEK